MKYRRAVNSHSIQFNQDALLGVNTNSIPFAWHQVTTAVFLWGEKVVAHDVQLSGRESGAELLEEGAELGRAFAVAEPVEHLPGGQIQRGEHVPDAAGAVERGPQPGRASVGKPVPARARLQVQRAELVNTDYPAVGWRMVVQVQNPGDLRGKVRVLAGLPRPAASWPLAT